LEGPFCLQLIWAWYNIDLMLKLMIILMSMTMTWRSCLFYYEMMLLLMLLCDKAMIKVRILWKNCMHYFWHPTLLFPLTLMDEFSSLSSAADDDIF